VSYYGIYGLDLYCDNRPNNLAAPDGIHRYNEFPHQFTAELGSDCRAQAREAGWRLKPDGRAMCPKCKNVPWPKEKAS
jgi:hypothetical protein